MMMLVIMLSIAISFHSCSKDDEGKETAGIDTRFVGTWERDASSGSIKEEKYTLVLSADGSCSYSWYRYSSIGNTNHASNGKWNYDAESNRIITNCTTNSVQGKTLILDVVSISETTLTVKQEGASSSRTYTKKK